MNIKIDKNLKNQFIISTCDYFILFLINCRLDYLRIKSKEEKMLIPKSITQKINKARQSSIENPTISKNWVDNISQKLFQKSKEIQNRNNNDMCQDETMLQLFNIEYEVNQNQSSAHTPYADYHKVCNNFTFNNEICYSMPYLNFLKENHQSQFFSDQMMIIENQLQKDKNYGESWKKINKKYNPFLEIDQQINLNASFQKFGFKVSKWKQFCPESSLKAFCFIVSIGNIINKKKVSFNSSTGFSLQKHDQVSLINFSKTFKEMFCSLCLTYNCERHPFNSIMLDKNFSNLPKINIKQRSKQVKESILNLYKYPRQDLQNDYCCQQCYRSINSYEQWEKIVSKKLKNHYSQEFIVLLKMGIQLFCYNPCQIMTIFHDTNKYQKITCKDIFYYLRIYVDVEKLISHNFCNSQYEKLLTIQKPNPFDFDEQFRQESRKINNKKKSKKNTILRNIRQKYIPFGSALCNHHFIGEQPKDLQCRNCECNGRGYCIEQCQCSSGCLIKLKGCDCNNFEDCQTMKCKCYLNNRVCDPQICMNCFGCQDYFKSNFCKNNWESMKKKKTQIGQSNISGAGLGLFANEDINTGEYVGNYTGEIILSQNCQIIRNEVSLLENSFYNFQLNAFQSIDARYFGSKLRFINHAVEQSNLYPIVMRFKEDQFIAFYATKNIEKGEQLLFDYYGGEKRKVKRDKRYKFLPK